MFRGYFYWNLYPMSGFLLEVFYCHLLFFLNPWISALNVCVSFIWLVVLYWIYWTPTKLILLIPFVNFLHHKCQVLPFQLVTRHGLITFSWQGGNDRIKSFGPCTAMYKNWRDLIWDSECVVSHNVVRLNLNVRKKMEVKSHLLMNITNLHLLFSAELFTRGYQD